LRGYAKACLFDELFTVVLMRLLLLHFNSTMSTSQTKDLSVLVTGSNGPLGTDAAISFLTWQGDPTKSQVMASLQAVYHEGDTAEQWIAQIACGRTSGFPQESSSSRRASFTPSKDKHGKVYMVPSYYPPWVQSLKGVSLLQDCNNIGVIESQGTSSSKVRRLYATGVHGGKGGSSKSTAKWVVVSEDLGEETWQSLLRLKVQRK
jgi:hypothetical protein